MTADPQTPRRRECVTRVVDGRKKNEAIIQCLRLLWSLGEVQKPCINFYVSGFWCFLACFYSVAKRIKGFVEADTVLEKMIVVVMEALLVGLV